LNYHPLTRDDVGGAHDRSPNKSRGVARVDDRRVISGIIHVLIYGPRKTLYNRWVRWAKAGVWARVFAELAALGGPPTALMLDPTWAKAHRSATGGKGVLQPTP